MSQGSQKECKNTKRLTINSLQPMVNVMVFHNSCQDVSIRGGGRALKGLSLVYFSGEIKIHHKNKLFVKPGLDTISKVIFSV